MPRAFVRICALTLISFIVTVGAAAARDAEPAGSMPTIPDLEPAPARVPTEVPAEAPAPQADLGPLPWDENAIVLASSYEDEMDPSVMAGCVACISGSSCCCTASGPNASCRQISQGGIRVVCSDGQGTTVCHNQGGCNCSSRGPGWVDPVDDPYTSN